MVDGLGSMDKGSGLRLRSRLEGSGLSTAGLGFAI